MFTGNLKADVLRLKIEGAKFLEGQVRGQLNRLNAQLDTLMEAKNDIENAESELSVAMTGDYNTLEIVSSENQGSSARNQAIAWQGIHRYLDNAKIAVANAVEDIDAAVRAKQAAVNAAETNLNQLSNAISQQESELEKIK